MKLLGERVEGVHLDTVKPNDWNPNRVTGVRWDSLVHNLREFGWVDSEPLLVWRTNNRGKAMNIIIDGEHRWKAAQEAGLKAGPMVFLDGLTKERAIALTISLDNNRGAPNQERLGAAIREVLPTLGDVTGLVLGFAPAEVVRLSELRPNLESNRPRVSQNTAMRMMPLFMTPEQYEVFNANIAKLSKRHNYETVTDAVIACVLDKRYDE